MIGVPSNFKSKFLVKILWPSLNGIIGKFCFKIKKLLPKNCVFEFVDLKTIFKGHGTPIFFPVLLKHNFRGSKKISFRIFKKCVSYDHVTLRGEIKKD